MLLAVLEGEGVEAHILDRGGVPQILYGSITEAPRILGREADVERALAVFAEIERGGVALDDEPPDDGAVVENAPAPTPWTATKR